MSNFYPLMVNLARKRIVVIGGGMIAERKVTSLIQTKADVMIVSPSLTKRLRALVHMNRLTWYKRRFHPEDVIGAFFVIAATNERIVNERVIASCPNTTLTLNVSDGKCGNVMMPAVMKQGKLTVAVSTNGTSPIVAKKVRNDIKTMLDSSLENVIDLSCPDEKDIIKF